MRDVLFTTLVLSPLTSVFVCVCVCGGGGGGGGGYSHLIIHDGGLDGVVRIFMGLP